MNEAQKSIKETRELLDQKRGDLMSRYIRVILENQIIIMKELSREKQNE